MLHEIETAQNDISAREDRILEIMMESDELDAGVKKGEAELKTSEKEIAAERAGARRRDWPTLQAEIDTTTAERAGARRARSIAACSRIFETIAQGPQRRRRRRGARRPVHHLPRAARPQVFNEVRRNESIIQCDSCQPHPLLRRREPKPPAPSRLRS